MKNTLYTFICCVVLTSAIYLWVLIISVAISGHPFTNFNSTKMKLPTNKAFEEEWEEGLRNRVVGATDHDGEIYETGFGELKSFIAAEKEESYQEGFYEGNKEGKAYILRYLH